MGYLSTYGKGSRKFQEGGMMGEAPAGPEAGAPAGPDAGAGQDQAAAGEQMLALAEATVQGDMEAAAQLGQALAPMILEQVQAEGGGMEGEAEMAPEGAEPMFSRGGVFVGKR